MSSTISKKRQKNVFTVGQHLKDLRNNRQITFDDLSEALKVSVNSLTKYESNHISPSLERLIQFAEFYGISLDFLVGWNKSEYIRSRELFSFAEIIDKLNQVKRFQIESTALSLIGQKDAGIIAFKEDSADLSDNLHQNIKTLIEINKMPLQAVADYLESTQGLISNYSRVTVPPIDKLVKLSKLFGVSIHCMATGKKLKYNFKNESLNEAIVKADQLLSLKDKDILVHLMKRIIEDTKSAA